MQTQETSVRCTTNTIMLSLKEGTAALHDATEHGAFNEELVKGRLPLEKYVASLEQMYLIHRALEDRLATLRHEMPSMGAVLRDYHFQAPYLLEDLAYFGRNPSGLVPLSATAAFLTEIKRLASTGPIALLGVFYVFEGSHNGGKFIARAVRRAYQLPDGRGTRYLDPYGEHQRAYWQQFKDDMNAQSFTAAEQDAMVGAAGATFEAVMRLHRELYEGGGGSANGNESF